MHKKNKRLPGPGKPHNKRYYNLTDIRKFSNVVNIGQCDYCKELITSDNFNCTDLKICLDCDLPGVEVNN